MSEEMIQMKGSVIENGETTKLKNIIEVDLFRDFFETDEPTTEQINEWKKIL